MISDFEMKYTWVKAALENKHSKIHREKTCMEITN